MKSSAIIEAAKKYLWDGVSPSALYRQDHNKTRFICFAIYRLGRGPRPRPTHKEVAAVQDTIMYRLGAGVPTLDKWLEIRLNVAAGSLPRKDVQAHRLAWMNLLIEEFKAKGD